MHNRAAFSFGKNWQGFLKSIDEQKVKIAQESLLGFLGVESIKGRTFLDIGCGSGLFSLAAYRLGAAKVVSFDVDRFSVQCCRHLKQKEGNPRNWQVIRGSILDRGIGRLGRFDIVYAWGCLHHTGSMWSAIRNAAAMVEEGGCLYLALYNDVKGPFGSRFWHRVKRIYNASPRPLRFTADYSYVALVALFRPGKVREYRQNSKRAMNLRTDASDWLGGYPYEYAGVDVVFAFMKKNFSGFVLENLKSVDGLGNNWYLFRRIR